MGIRLDIASMKIIHNDDLPSNWVEMNHEEKDEWVRDWVEEEQQYDYVDIEMTCLNFYMWMYIS